MGTPRQAPAPTHFFLVRKMIKVLELLQRYFFQTIRPSKLCYHISRPIGLLLNSNAILK